MLRPQTIVTCVLPLFALAACAVGRTHVWQAEVGITRCIPLDQVVGRRVVGSHLVFETTGPTDFRNDLIGGCPRLVRLRSSATVSIASGGDGGQLCRGDRVRIADPVEAGATGLLNQPTCQLGDFRLVSRR